MPSKSEMTWKHQVAQNYFGKFGLALDEKRIDFIVLPQGGTLEVPMLWAESKRETSDVPKMFAQLLLTIRPVLDKGQMPPKYLCAFDKEKIAFLEFHHIIPIFNLNDFDWTERPSNVSKKTENTVAQFLSEAVVFTFTKDDKEIKEFIKTNFVIDLFGDSMEQIQVTRNNFLHVYIKWTEQVKPTIKADFARLKKDSDILDGDFFLADLLSEDKHHTSQFHSLYRDLFVVLQDYCYRITVDKFEGLLREIYFEDNQKAHREFWKRYKRPPKEEYHDLMKARRDLLVPQTVRERQGAYFTPKIWVEKSQGYLAKTFGENWQDEYYIWDCCCGTGNLLAGLTNKYNIWASTLDEPDVAIVHDMINHGFNLLKSHVFKFDFLNGNFDKLPEELRDIINDPEKQKRLIIFINPPYAEAMNKRDTKNAKTDVNRTRTEKKYSETIGKAIREIFVQFFIRTAKEIPTCRLASFSTLKYVSSPNFLKFRQHFKAKYEDGFICRADTFDNVNGRFPIGFLIWNLSARKTIKQIKTDVLGNNRQVTECWKEGVKVFHTIDEQDSINDWLKQFVAESPEKNPISMCCIGNDFQHNNYVNISREKQLAGVGNAKGIAKFALVPENFIEACIYFSVRHCIKAVWLNDRDQFLFPNDGYLKSKRFQNDCIVFTLFHHQNRLCSRDGMNHLLPFSAGEVNAKDNFKSSMLCDFLKNRKLSKQANAVLSAGKALWTYYHETIKNDKSAFNDASLYEIREYFKGRKNGRLNTKSTDVKFNDLDKALREAMQKLAEAIRPCVYEYGFLLE